MSEINIPSELRVARYAEARLKEIEALTQVLGKHEKFNYVLLTIALKSVGNEL